MGVKWTDTEALAERLDSRWPALDPLSVGFRDLLKAVRALDDFDDDPDAVDPDLLELIQSRWYARFRRRDVALHPGKPGSTNA